VPEEANEREAAAGNLEEKQRPPCAALLEREIDARLEDGDREGAARAANALGEMLLGEERLSVTRPIAGRSAWVSRGGSHRRSPHISEGRVRARPRACPARLSGGLQEPQGDRGLPRQAALLPLASGTDVFILLGREESYDKALLVAIGLFGFAVTLGLFVYERGIQDCITLRKRTRGWRRASVSLPIGATSTGRKGSSAEL
jgi:hypothetical protein